MENPFYTNARIPDRYFCDREEETRILENLLTNRNNVLLTSPRRMGKSGLIRHLFGQERVQEIYYTLFVDIYDTSNLKEFVAALSRELLKSKAIKRTDLLSKLMDALKGAEYSLSPDPYTGLPNLNVLPGKIKMPDKTLDELFLLMEKAKKRFLIAIDEFQKIADYEEGNVEATLRTKVQHLSNVDFIFSGSEPTLLSQMFFTKARPFYRSVTPLSLQAIDKEVYLDFAERLFIEGGKTLAREAVSDLYDLMEGYTYFNQRVLNECFSRTPEGGLCSRETILGALEWLLSTEEFTYKDLLAHLTPNQRELFYAVAAEHPARNIQAEAFLTKYGFATASAVQNAARGLVSRGVVSKRENAYCIDDKFLELWAATRRGQSLGAILAHRRG